MKRIVTIIVCLIMSISVLCAHDVNQYKYFCLDVEDNPYGIEKRFLEEFRKAGFIIISTNTYRKILDPEEKAKTLFAEYDYFLNYNGNSSLTITLKNANGITVWNNIGYGCTFLSASGDFKKCTKQIMTAFKRLKYKFDESFIPEQKTIQHPFASWTEDSVKTYLRGKRISPLEGIFKNYSNDGDAYSIAILKYEDKFFGIILDADNELWKAGDTKIILRHIQGSSYDAEYYELNNKKINAIAKIENRLLEFSAPYKGDIKNFSFIKIFPSSGEKAIGGAFSNEQCKAMGSGVLISDNIIITNYHVVEDAEKIETIININGIPETFSARVLCTDKTNDLAIVCVKDDKFKSVGDAPFQILPNTIDVGTSVFTMGFPFTTFLGDEVKITDGIISSKSGYEGDIVTYQISAPIQPGNSGGPLFDKYGNLVGITSAGINKSVAENVGYAIKTPYVLNIIDSAPINISLPKSSDLMGAELPELIKALKPYVVYIKIY